MAVPSPLSCNSDSTGGSAIVATCRTPPDIPAIKQEQSSCSVLSRSLSTNAAYCIPKRPQMEEELCSQPKTIEANITCPNGYAGSGFFALVKDDDGPGCVYSCEPSPTDPTDPTAPPAAVPYPPALQCAPWKCEDKMSTCAGNVYYNPASSKGYNSAYSVCLPDSKINTKEECSKSDATKYISCPNKYEANKYFQTHPGCYYTCEKQPKHGPNWVMIIAIGAGVVGVLLLLFMIMHRRGDST